MVFYVAQYPTFRYPPTASLKLLLTRLNAVIVVASRFNVGLGIVTRMAVG